MSNLKKPALAAAACGLLAVAAGAQTTSQTVTQTSIVRAPIAAVAFGPSTAEVSVNASRSGHHTVVVTRPLVAVGTPLHSMRIRVN